MKLSALRRPIRFSRQDLLRAVELLVEQALLESNLLNEAFSQLFFDKYPEFDKQTIIRILAVLTLEKQMDPRTDLKNTLKQTLYRELTRTLKVPEARANEIIGSDYVMRNFIEGSVDRPSWAKLKKPVKKLIAQRKQFED
jgi:hypothetical protein